MKPLILRTQQPRLFVFGTSSDWGLRCYCSDTRKRSLGTTGTTCKTSMPSLQTERSGESSMHVHAGTSCARIVRNAKLFAICECKSYKIFPCFVGIFRFTLTLWYPASMNFSYTRSFPFIGRSFNDFFHPRPKATVTVRFLRASY